MVRFLAQYIVIHRKQTLNLSLLGITDLLNTQKESNMPIVYVTTNNINGKKYLGKCCHKKTFYLGSGVALKSAIKKYGKENFTREIICEVDTLEEASEVERKLSVLWNVVDDLSWYNLKPGGDGGSLKGRNISEETKQKISRNRKGKLSQLGTLNNFYGKKHTNEWKENHSKLLKGREGNQGEQHASSKIVIFTNLLGQSFRVKGIRQFCRDNNISFSNVIWRLRNNKDIPTKCGWKVMYD
jgi:group I intron endonuclease